MKYGQHLSLNEVTQLIAPSDTAIRSISGWLESGGVESIGIAVHRSRDFIEVTTKVEVVESLLQIRMHRFMHTDRCDV